MSRKETRKCVVFSLVPTEGEAWEEIAIETWILAARFADFCLLPSTCFCDILTS